MLNNLKVPSNQLDPGGVNIKNVLSYYLFWKLRIEPVKFYNYTNFTITEQETIKLAAGTVLDRF